MEAFYYKNGWQSIGSHTDPLLGKEDYVGINLSTVSYPNIKVAYDNWQITNKYLGNRPLYAVMLLLD